MRPYDRHVFVCEHVRPPDDPKGCCASRGSGEIRSALSKLAFDAGLKGRVRISAAGCLGQCAQGATVVVYPEAVWYGHVRLEDVDEIFREHVLGGRPVERLRIDAPAGRP